jgi:hypothetical protein
VCIVAVRDPSMWCATLIIVVFARPPSAMLSLVSECTDRAVALLMLCVTNNFMRANLIPQSYGHTFLILKTR